MPVRAARPVHPHGCGEHLAIAYVGPGEARFIPTGVGNTGWTSSPIEVRNGSSPRVWGTLRAYLAQFYPLHGSSPRVWGTRKVSFID